MTTATRPVPFRSVQPAGLPAQLRNLPGRHFLLWRAEPRDGTLTKLPIRPDGEHANVTAPSHRLTFDQAVSLYKRGRSDGIGLVLSPDLRIDGQRLTVIDLDHVFDASGSLSAEAAAIVQRFPGAAWDRSVGTGLHGFVLGEKHTARCRTGWIEVYDDKRFITLTGHPLPGTATTLTDQQATLDAFLAELFPLAQREEAPAPRTDALGPSDAEALARARSANSGPRFSRAYDAGDWQATGRPSPSEADAWLMGRLAHATGEDEAQMLRLFAGSALAGREKAGRVKWERPDYQQATLAEGLRQHAGCWCKAPRRRPADTPLTSPHLEPDTAGDVAPPLDAPAEQDAGLDAGADAGTGCACPCCDHHGAGASALAALQAETAGLRAELRALRALHSGVMTALANPHLSAQERIVAVKLATRTHAVSATAADPAAAPEPASALPPAIFIGDGTRDGGGLAADAGASPSTTGRLLKQLNETGIFRRSAMRVARGNVYATRVHMQPTSATLIDTLTAIATWTPAAGTPSKRGHGGKRVVCPDCGDAGVTITTTTSCAGCGQVLAVDQQTHAPEADAPAEQDAGLEEPARTPSAPERIPPPCVNKASNLLGWAEPPRPVADHCPACGDRLIGNTCWTCRDRLCAMCGGWTGRPYLARCPSCDPVTAQLMADGGGG